MYDILLEHIISNPTRLKTTSCWRTRLPVHGGPSGSRLLHIYCNRKILRAVSYPCLFCSFLLYFFFLHYILNFSQALVISVSWPTLLRDIFRRFFLRHYSDSPSVDFPGRLLHLFFIFYEFSFGFIKLLADSFLSSICSLPSFLLLFLVVAM